MTAGSARRPPTPRSNSRDARPVPARTLRCSDCGVTVVALVGDRAGCECVLGAGHGGVCKSEYAMPDPAPKPSGMAVALRRITDLERRIATLVRDLEGGRYR